MRRVAVRMGRPFTALVLPPFAGVALNKLAPPPEAPPKLNAPPAPLLPGVAAVLDALAVFELPLPEPKAKGAAVAAPKANGGGAAAAVAVVAGSEDMPNGLTEFVGTGILLAMPPNEDGAALPADVEPKAKGDEEAEVAPVVFAVLALYANGVEEPADGVGCCCCWAGDDVPPKLNAEEEVAPNDGGAAAWLADEAPNANGFAAGDAELPPKKLLLV